MRILVVEDEKKVASFIKKGLQQEGYAADTVHDGDEAVHNAISFDYDLIVLDVMLPRMNGFDVCRELRQRGVTTPILMLTARGQVVERSSGSSSVLTIT